MSTRPGFRDHIGFHRAAAAMTAGGAIAGAAAGLLGAGVAGALFAGATGAVLGMAWTDRAAGLRRAVVRALAVPVAIGAFYAAGGSYAGVAALSVIVAVALNLGITGWKRLVAAIVVGGGLVYLGAFAAGQTMIARETQPLPHALEVMIAGLAMSMVSMAALLPRHLVLVTDPIAAAQRALPATLHADVRAIVDRGLAVWRQAPASLDAEGRALLRDAVLRLHDLAQQHAKIAGPAESAATLEARKAALEVKIDSTKDDVAKASYRAAQGAIDDQLRYVASIDQQRERVLARLHECVNTLEKFDLATAVLPSGA